MTKRLANPMDRTEQRLRAARSTSAKKAAAVVKNARKPPRPGSKPRGQHGHADWIARHGVKP